MKLYLQNIVEDIPSCSYDFCMVYLPEWNDKFQKISEDI